MTMETNTATTPRVGTREEWLAARLELLRAEKALTQQSDELARQRQALPWVRVEKPYRFDTDDGVDLAIQAGFNQPYVEYQHVTGTLSPASLPSSLRQCAWFDTDKDPACFLANLGSLRDEQGRRRHAVFPFLGHGDWRPLWSSMGQQASSWLKNATRRMSRAPRQQAEA